MLIKVKNTFSNFVFSLLLFSLLLIGTQNSTKSSRINLIFNETINLPIGFLVGSSFVFGYFLGGLFFVSKKK